MSNMQAFREWFSQIENPQNAEQRHLMRLAQASRAQVLEAIAELTWFIWDAEQAASA